jgi:hypothetical protein
MRDGNLKEVRAQRVLVHGAHVYQLQTNQATLTNNPYEIAFSVVFCCLLDRYHTLENR